MAGVSQEKAGGVEGGQEVGEQGAAHAQHAPARASLSLAERQPPNVVYYSQQ